jgi:AcrR family transcriptional regulator
MVRDAEKTRERILAAVGEVLAAEGFPGVGVNAIARAAGVDKVLIYRYFGGLPQLLEAYARTGDVWPSLDEIFQRASREVEGGEPSALATALFVAHLRALEERPLTQELMRWELLERNEVVEALARAREEQGLELLERIPASAQPPADVDLSAVIALVMSGLTYLLLRRKTADVYMGVRLDGPEGWARIERAVGRICRALFAGAGPAGSDGPGAEEAPARPPEPSE